MAIRRAHIKGLGLVNVSVTPVCYYQVTQSHDTVHLSPGHPTFGDKSHRL